MQRDAAAHARSASRRAILRMPLLGSSESRRLALLHARGRALHSEASRLVIRRGSLREAADLFFDQRLGQRRYDFPDCGLDHFSRQCQHGADLLFC